jgi:hypothetical protein
MKNCYVYIHKKADTKEIFYVGIGNQLKYRRAYQITANRRSKEWLKVVKKHGVEVEIYADNLTREQAIEIEILLIEKYGRIDLGNGVLVNMTKGGDGFPILSDEVKKRNPRNRGQKRAEHATKITIEKLTGRILSEETKEKMRLAKIGKKQSEKHLENRKNALKNATYKGRTILNVETNETFNSISEAARFYKIDIATLNKKLNGKIENNTKLIIK